MNRTRTLMCVALLAASAGLAQDELDGGLKPAPTRRHPSMFHRPVKDTPAEQLAYAETLSGAGRTGRAMKEYRALVHEWHTAPEAAKAQEAYARLLVGRGKYRAAFDELQYLIDNFQGRFGYADVIDEQFKIAHEIMTRRRAQWLGMPGFTSPGAALPLFEKVLANAPAGRRAAEARFFTGVIHEEAGDYDAAAVAFRAVRSRHPDSFLGVDANFRYAYCMYRIANASPRDERRCRNAFSELAGFVRLYPQSGHAPAAEKYMDELRERLASMYYAVATFYDRPMYKPVAALIAYGDFLRKFPSSDMAPRAKRRMAELEKEGEVDDES